MIDFNGSPVSAMVPGDREHWFRLPRDRASMPPKTLAALDAVQQATKGAADAQTPKAQQAATEAVRAAVGDLYDRVASTSRADREHHREGFAYAGAKFDRAIGEAQAALQLLADHAQQFGNPGGVGFPEDPRANSSAVMQLRLIADALKNLPAVPELEA
ncbi:hypothetical protein OG780_19390 [Streptomyces sp. NBC_00386]|uniref:hypothetical protein n=1 Tax=Streptomyces sp. NBC_00386 TaxID=2975734 RepID=UPI002E1B7D13